ncbi:hypothetical protein Hanom_Chr08g00718931 [Helianthus anomalus]
MLSDRPGYWVLLFERFVLVGLCYLCVFSGQRHSVFASIVDISYAYCYVRLYEKRILGFLQYGDVFGLAIAFDDSYPMLSMMTFCWVVGFCVFDVGLTIVVTIWYSQIVKLLGLLYDVLLRRFLLVVGVLMYNWLCIEGYSVDDGYLQSELFVIRLVRMTQLLYATGWIESACL